MRLASTASLLTAVAVSACQAPPSGLQAAPSLSAASPTACPSPGSTVELLRTDNGRSARVLTYLPPSGSEEEGLCATRSGPDRRMSVNIVGRSIQPGARREHARMQSELAALRVGSTASGFANLSESAGQRSVQVQVTYEVLRDERVTVPAGTFDTVVVQEQERNGSCIANWTAWLDKDTHLPVKLHSETLRCLQVRQFDAVAGQLKRA